MTYPDFSIAVSCHHGFSRSQNENIRLIISAGSFVVILMVHYCQKLQLEITFREFKLSFRQNYRMDYIRQGANQVFYPKYIQPIMGPESRALEPFCSTH